MRGGKLKGLSAEPLVGLKPKDGWGIVIVTCLLAEPLVGLKRYDTC